MLDNGIILQTLRCWKPFVESYCIIEMKVKKTFHIDVAFR